MAYADQKMSTNRMITLGVVAVIHVFLGYAIVTGLAGNIVKKITEPLKTVNIKEEVKPPEEPPPPPPKDIEIPPFVPPPEVTIDAPPPAPTITVQQKVQQVEPPKFVAPVAVAPAPPAPPASPPSPSVLRGGGISEDDYPEASKRAEEQGVTRVSYTVGVDGKASGCSVITSSGFPRLDETTCKLVERRFRFKPATRDGKPVTETKQQAVRWQLKDGR